MKKIEAKELTKIMKELSEETSEWSELTDLLANKMIELEYATENILDLEYCGTEYDYIWSQLQNFWKTFLKNDYYY